MSGDLVGARLTDCENEIGSSDIHPNTRMLVFMQLLCEVDGVEKSFGFMRVQHFKPGFVGEEDYNKIFLHVEFDVKTFVDEFHKLSSFDGGTKVFCEVKPFRKAFKNKFAGFECFFYPKEHLGVINFSFIFSFPLGEHDEVYSEVCIYRFIYFSD